MPTRSPAAAAAFLELAAAVREAPLALPRSAGARLTAAEALGCAYFLEDPPEAPASALLALAQPLAQ